MNTKEIVLTNGETLSVKINFYTQFLLVENKVIELSEQIKEDPDNVLLNMKMAGKMIYVLLKSNGKAVTEEEALMLAPFDTDEIEELFKQFEERIEEFKKKTGKQEATSTNVEWEKLIYMGMKMGLTETEFWNMDPFLFYKMLDFHLEIEERKNRNG